jgi:hypothetical protein
MFMAEFSGSSNQGNSFAAFALFLFGTRTLGRMEKLRYETSVTSYYGLYITVTRSVPFTSIYAAVQTPIVMKTQTHPIWICKL